MVVNVLAGGILPASRSATVAIPISHRWVALERREGRGAADRLPALPREGGGFPSCLWVSPVSQNLGAFPLPWQGRAREGAARPSVEVVVAAARGADDLALAGVVGLADDALALHALHQRRGPVVAHLQAAL